MCITLIFLHAYKMHLTFFKFHAEMYRQLLKKNLHLSATINDDTKVFFHLFFWSQESFLSWEQISVFHKLFNEPCKLSHILFRLPKYRQIKWCLRNINLFQQIFDEFS